MLVNMTHYIGTDTDKTKSKKREIYCPNKSQHTKLTLEKKILPPLLPGFELATFRSRVRHSSKQATPAPPIIIMDQSYIEQIFPSRKLRALAHTIHTNIHTDINIIYPYIHTHACTHTRTHTHTSWSA